MINNILNNFFDSTHQILNPELSRTLQQGKDFKKYQKRIRNRNKYLKEGFSTQPTNDAKKSRQVLQENKLSNNQAAELSELKHKYDSLLEEYKKAQKEALSETKDYIDRTESANPYHGTNVTLGDVPNQLKASGFGGYVTNKGLFKPYSSESDYDLTAGKNGCPAGAQYTSIFDAGNKFTASLEQGTPIVPGQSCGNEGNNVYVSDVLPNNLKTTYKGCFKDDPNSPSMSFIGGSPPPTPIKVENGDFSQPVLANNSYQYITGINSWGKVPGWIFFNAVLINNSEAWGFPMPYPKGSQAVSIQKKQNIGQFFIVPSASNYTLSFYACGRPSLGPNDIGIYLIDDFFSDKEVLTFTPTTSWKKYSVPLKISRAGFIVLLFVGLDNHNSGADLSSAIQDIIITSDETKYSQYTHNTCKQAAINGGYRYFSLQDTNPQTSTGYCALTNNIVGAEVLGNATIVSGTIALWSSNTKTNISKNSPTATLTDLGQLVIKDSAPSQSVLFQTPNKENSGGHGSYIGCYSDTSNRAMANTSDGQWLPMSQCKNLAAKGGFKYYAGQDADGNGNNWCAAGNDMSAITKYGPSTNCVNNSSGAMEGGPWANAVYAVEPGGNYFLILQDDGNMCIYKGTGPTDNQGLIWATNTNGKQKDPSATYTAAQSKFKQNWIPSGTILKQGDFIGSTDGSIYLMMLANGELVLYTSTNASACKAMGDKTMGGGLHANAIYDLGLTGYPGNLGKMGYVDDDGNLSEYPSSMKLEELPGTFKTTSNVDSVQWQNYRKTEKMVSDKTFGIKGVISSRQQQRLDQLQGQINMLAQQITELTNDLQGKNIKINDQMKTNKGLFSENIKDYQFLTKDRQPELQNIQGIVNDSDIKVLQENYSYLLWSILAIGAVSLTLSIA